MKRISLPKTLLIVSTFLTLAIKNNPPDGILRGGDAIEVKKVESRAPDLQLNSSYPKNRLYSDNPRITQGCRECEDWRVKDLMYIVGRLQEGHLHSLWIAYGDCWVADSSVYENLTNAVTESVRQTHDLEFSQTKELARVNKVDPLGITYLRVRGVWGIRNPAQVFGYIANASRFNVHVIMLEKKYHSFKRSEKHGLESLVSSGLAIEDVNIKSPDNPAQLLRAKLIQ